MDFPAVFQKDRVQFVNSIAEVQAAMYHLLRIPKGEFLSGPELGSYIDIHTTEINQIPTAIKMTIEEIPGVTFESARQVNDSTWKVSYSYRNDKATFDLDLRTLYDSSRN